MASCNAVYFVPHSEVRKIRMPFLYTLSKLMCNICRFMSRCAETRARKVFRSNSFISCSPDKYLRIIWISHIVRYLETGGLFLNFPFMKSCYKRMRAWPIAWLFTCTTIAEIALLAVFKVVYLNPLSNNEIKKSKNFPTVIECRFICTGRSNFLENKTSSLSFGF